MRFLFVFLVMLFVGVEANAGIDFYRDNDWGHGGRCGYKKAESMSDKVEEMKKLLAGEEVYKEEDFRKRIVIKKGFDLQEDEDWGVLGAQYFCVRKNGIVVSESKDLYECEEEYTLVKMYRKIKVTSDDVLNFSYWVKFISTALLIIICIYKYSS